MDFVYKTEIVCAVEIRLHIEDDIITNVRFTGGCNGNLKAVAKLVDGMTVDEIEAKLGGNLCNRKPTSCADQLAKAVRAAYNQLHGVA